MKRLLLIPAILCLAGTFAHAGLTVIGSGELVQIDTSGFPGKMKEHYRLMESRCGSCHSLERVVMAVQTGVAPITGQPFDWDAARVYMKKIGRKPDANITSEEGKEILDLLNFMLTETGR